MYFPRFDRDQEADPLFPEPQPQDAGINSSPLRDPGESLEDLPSLAKNHDGVITVEVG